MPDLPQLLALVAAGLLLNLTPGPDVLYVVTGSLRSGARAGIGMLFVCFGLKLALADAPEAVRAGR